MQPYVPGSQRRRRFRNIRIKLYIISGAVLLALIGGVYLIRETGLFKIRSIEVIHIPEPKAAELLAMVKSEVLRGAGASFLGADNYLAWPSSVPFPKISYVSVYIEKHLITRTIAVGAELREPFAIWCRGNEDEAVHCAWVDRKDGIVLKPAVPTEGQIIPAVYDEDAFGDFPLGEPAIKPEFYPFVRSIIEAMPKLQIAVSRFSINRTLEEFTVGASDGASLVFSLRFDPNVSLAAVKKILEETPLTKIRRLDLTVPNKIYLTKRG